MESIFRKSKNFTSKNTEQNKAIIFRLLQELKNSFQIPNIFFKNNDKYSYEKMLFDFNEKTFDTYYNIIEESCFSNTINLDDFNDYFNHFRLKNKNLKEIGILYPFKIDHDIFTKKNYLLEVNHLKFLT